MPCSNQETLKAGVADVFSLNQWDLNKCHKKTRHPMHVSGKGSGSEACLHAPSVPFGPLNLKHKFVASFWQRRVVILLDCLRLRMYIALMKMVSCPSLSVYSCVYYKSVTSQVHLMTMLSRHFCLVSLERHSPPAWKLAFSSEDHLLGRQRFSKIFRFYYLVK